MRLVLPLSMILLGIALAAGGTAFLGGLLLVGAGAYLYDKMRGPGRGGEGAAAVVLLLGALGAAVIVVQFAWQRLTALL